MKKDNPLFDPATHYRIEVQGQVDVVWLQSFESSAEIIIAETKQSEGVTVIDVHADQAGIVGLLRKLHGLGITIQEFHVVLEGAGAVDLQSSAPDNPYHDQSADRQDEE